MTKKLLSVVLALTMVLGVFAISASALGADDIGLVVTADKTTGVKKDDIVTVSFAFEQDASNTWNLGSGNIVIAYNAEYFAPNGNESTVRTFGASYPCYEAATTPNLAMINNLTLTTDEAKDYTAAIGVPLSFDANVVASGKVGYAITSGATVFTLSFKALKDVDKDVKFGVPGSTLGGTCNLKYATGSKATKYAAGKMNIDKAVATITAPAAAKPITFVKTQAQWVDGDNTQPNWKLGIVGKFKTSDIAIAFNDAGTSTNVTEVGVDVTAGDYTTKEATRFVYDNGDGTYSYRAVVTNIPYDVAADKEITVTFYAMVGGEKVVGETKTFNLADEFAAAQSRTPAMPAYAG